MDKITQSKIQLEEDIKVLSKQKDVEFQNSRTLVRKVHDLELDVEKLKRQNSQLEELEETKNALKLTSCKNRVLEEDVRKLQNQIKNLSCEREEEKCEAERTRRRAEMATSRISALEKEIAEYKRTNDKLQSENQAYRKENEQLRMQKGELEAHNSTNEKCAQEERQMVSALQTSAEALEKALTESHQREIERLREMHRSDREEQDKRHAAEK